MLAKLINKILGDPNEKALQRMRATVDYINSIEARYQTELTAEQIPPKTAEFKARISAGETTFDLLPEAFALVKFTCKTLLQKKWEVRGREITWDMVPYDVQLIGGITLHEGRISEMKTGEGKTLVCTLPIYLNALTGKGVHLVTVNEYLASRDAEWMGGLYRALGLTVGIISHGQNHNDKKAAYACDITYGTNNEFGFDYLRDNMAVQLEHCVQRGLHYAIVDEVDSILIDEARTPLIISAPAEESTDKYTKYSRLITQLQENQHYTIDEKAKTAILTEEGVTRMEQLLDVENIYTEKGFEEVHHIEQALRAHTCYKNDVDYMVKDGKIVIVDEFTGRMMEGRRYSNGLHQAIEAKEGVDVKQESKTLATITFQNYFRLYEKLAGMTGTALTEAEEFASIYGLDTLVIPTHNSLVRNDIPDVIYKDTKGKYMAIANKVKELHEKGQPVLIGTISVEKSEMLSKLLTMQGIKHNVLNAKHHEREAEIIATAGQKGAVTIATNMAGRGTDIKLGEGVKELGGLYVIGTERHESRRIDNQLRGRSGRQGDPGATQFYISMDDDLMRLFGGDRMKGMMEKLGVPEDMPIENRLISRSIEGAQKRVEGRNFDIRKHLVEYDDTMNKHREIMYRRRRDILEHEDIKEKILEWINKEANRIIMQHSNLESAEKWNYAEMAQALSGVHRDSEHELTEEELRAHEKSEDLVRVAQEFLQKEYEEKEKSLPTPELMRKIERAIALRVIDTLWMQHIDEMTQLRENVALRSYGQRDPLIEYKGEAFEMFTALTEEIEKQTASTLFKVKVERAEEQAEIRAIPIVQKLFTNASAIENTLSSNQLQRIAEGGSRAKEKLDVMERQGGVMVRRSNHDAQEQGASPSVTHTTENIRVIKADESVPKTFTSSSNMPPSTTPSTPSSKIGRNDPCSCGSGKKYKKCHGA